jgi:hypothetical protein
MLSQELSSGDACTLILPHVILWNPLVQFADLNLVCPESECSAKMHTRSWKHGHTKGLQPRILHDVDYTILLVSALWCCDEGHSISSTDSRILQFVVQKTGFRPFILLHKTGFTSTFVTTVIELIHEGNSFSGIERIITRKRQLYVTTRVSSSGGDRGEASSPNPLASPPKNLTFNLIKHHDITQSLKITPLFHRTLTEISHKLSENTSQGTWHATYAPSFIALPPQIFVAR